MGSPLTGQEAQNRSSYVKGSVTPKEQEEIIGAFDNNGLPNPSRATRAILLAYSRSPKVRDAIAAFLRDNMEILAA